MTIIYNIPVLLLTKPSDGGEGGTCIDNIFVKSKSIIFKTFKLMTPITDQYLLFISLNKLQKSLKNYSQILYDFI